MKNHQDDETVTWLFANAGLIIRWRMVKDLGIELPKKKRAELLGEVLATDEVIRWLGNFRKRVFHGSKDTNAENAMAKLVEYGLHAGIPEFDEKMLPYVERLDRLRQRWLRTECPFLIAAGYHTYSAVRKWFLHRLDSLHKVALRGDYNLYLSNQGNHHIPKAWRNKPVYRPEFWLGDDGLTLPTCYDLYALAHWPCSTSDEEEKIADVIAYLSDPAFQSTVGGYIWNPNIRRCHAAGRDYLACLNPERVVLFIELTARFPAARRMPWFQEALDDFEQYRTEDGRYCFPSEYLKEKRNSYYIYQGAHMGLGENRRSRNWRELESTFRMQNIKRLMTM